MSKVQQSIDDLQNTVNRVNSEELGDRQNALTDAREALSKLQNLQTEAEGKVTTHKNDMKTREQEYKDKVQAVRNLQDSLESQLSALEQKKRNEKLDAMDRQDQLEEIEAQRAPVAELYYNQENGPTSYTVDGRTIRADLLLRRQLKIREDSLLAWFDTTVALEDPLLIESLSDLINR